MAKKPKSALSRPGFLPWSRKYTRRGLFVMIFASIGIYFTLFTNAATEPSVRFVFLCATDVCNTSLGGTSTVDTRGESVQNWYESKLGNGRTFRKLPTVKMTGKHTSSYYKNNGPYSGKDAPTQNTFYNIANESGLHEANVKTVYVLGFHPMNHCGVGASGDTAIVDPFQGCSGYQNSVYAHELGHAFGLGHTADGNLMSAPVACGGQTLSNCNMGTSQRSYLLNNRSAWFPTPTYDQSSTPTAPPSVPSIGDVLYTNQTLNAGYQLTSSDGRYKLVMQVDGNLVLYSPYRAIWYSNTPNTAADKFILQNDGNLVIYNSRWVAVWQAHTYNKGGAALVMQSDGNLVLYNTSWQPVWYTNTAGVL